MRVSHCSSPGPFSPTSPNISPLKDSPGSVFGGPTAVSDIGTGRSNHLNLSSSNIAKITPSSALHSRINGLQPSCSRRSSSSPKYGSPTISEPAHDYFKPISESTLEETHVTGVVPYDHNTSHRSISPFSTPSITTSTPSSSQGPPAISIDTSTITCPLDPGLTPSTANTDLSLRDLKIKSPLLHSTAATPVTPYQPGSRFRKSPPGKLDLFSDNSGIRKLSVPSISSNFTNLQTPRSARNSHFSSFSLPSEPSNKNMSVSGDTSETRHSRYRSPSLPINTLVPNVELPDSIQHMTPDTLAGILSNPSLSHNLLLVDIRPFSQFTATRIMASVNICLPSTLLKRPTFVLSRFVECMIPEQRPAIQDLSRYDSIVLYDASTKDVTLGGPSPLYYTLLKFSRSPEANNDNNPGKLFYLRGGISEFSQHYAGHLDKEPPRFSSLSIPSPCRSSTSSSSSAQSNDSAKFNDSSHITGTSPLKTLSIDQPLALPPVLTGFSLPTNSTKDGPSKAFYSNIRTNVECYDFTDDPIPIALPNGVNFDSIKSNSLVPKWIKNVCNPQTGPKMIAQHFHDIEVAEKSRLQAVFSKERAFNLTAAGQNGVSSPQEADFSISAGMELGGKNRYNNIFPYDHNRVRLQDEPHNDYINASYVSIKNCEQRYIATQGPLPDTYKDFWKVVWDHKVPVIVMLTLESEGGQLKCHPYWKDGPAGNFEIQTMSVQEVPLVLDDQTLSNLPSSVIEHLNSNVNTVTIRELLLTCPSGTHQVSQIHYKAWPDLGAPASPRDLIALCQIKNHIADRWQQQHPDLASGPHPYSIVHCSAGCGRTGTFCTVDSVIDMIGQAGPSQISEDIIYKVVHALRRQRLSMVQSLRQFALCYETVLLWYQLTGMV